MRSVSELRRWAAEAPAGTTVPVSALVELLDEVVDGQPAPAGDAVEDAPVETWRERLWTVPAETRLGVAEVAEAMGRPRSWVYARTSPSAEHPLPTRRLDGAIVVTAGELRAWIRSREEVVHAGPMESTPAERRLGVVS